MKLTEKINNYLNEEKKITKTNFTKLHKNGELGLIAGGVKGDVKHVIGLIRKLKDLDSIKLNMKKTTNVDVGDQKATGFIQKVYLETIYDADFYILETKIDNSKNADVSWNTLENFCTVYIKLDKKI